MAPPEPGNADASDLGNVPSEYKTRWVYFGLFAWLQCSGRFMSLYYLNEGLTEAEIGAVFAVGNVTALVAAPMVSLLADHLSARKGPVGRLICFGCCILWGTIAFSLQAARPAHVPRFWVMMVCRVLLDSARPASVSLLDAITIDGLSDRRRYGQERLFGAYSWAVLGLVLGALMDRWGPRVTHVCIPLMALGVLLSLWQAGSPSAAAAAQRGAGRAQASEGGFCILMRSYVSSPAKVSFFVYAIALGVGMTLVENLLFLYFRQLHASYVVCGMSVVVTVVFEIPLFSQSPNLLARFGVRGLLAMAGVCYSLRVVGYTLVPGGAWVLFFEPMHGVTYAAWQTASVEAMASITPPHLAATGQAFLSSLRGGFGATAGNLVGGIIIDTYGEATLYRSAAVLVAAGLALYLAANRKPFGDTGLLSSQTSEDCA